MIVDDVAVLLTLLCVMGGLLPLALGLCADGVRGDSRYGLAGGGGGEQAGHVQGDGDDGLA